MNGITDRQREILSFVSTFQRESGAPPTLREIARHFRFSSATAAAAHLRALRRKGYLEHTPRQARGSRIVPENGRHELPLARIPVYSSIPKVTRRTSTEGFKGWLAFDSATWGIEDRNRVFALAVRGDALCRWHILDGDLLVMEQGRTPAVGEVVAILDDDEPELTVFAGGRRRPEVVAQHGSTSCPPFNAEKEVLAVMVALIRMPASAALRASDFVRPASAARAMAPTWRARDVASRGVMAMFRMAPSVSVVRMRLAAILETRQGTASRFVT